MSLQKYWAKRDFKKTPEPRGSVAKPQTERKFFIQKHDATHLHYDFRLELEGTLKSWAVPKGPSLNPGDKRLAVHVEDHPLDYGNFEGVIPARQYGAGTVLLWDKGVWLAQGDAAEGYRKGHLKFQLQGEKLSGGWALVRMAKPASGAKENWLLIKEHDTAARSGDAADITALRPESVLTGMTHIPASEKSRKQSPAAKPAAREKTTAAKSSVTQSRKKTGAATALASNTTNSIATQPGARKARMPALIKPQLATLTETPPLGEEWLCEVKFDGYRALARIDQGTAQLFTRAGNNWSAKWPGIAAALSQLAPHQAWLDGEVVAVDEEGKISFQALQNFTRKGQAARLVYYVFDLVYLDGYDLSAVPQIERKRWLASLLARLPEQQTVLYNAHIVGDAAQVFEHACMHSLEGIVVKRADAAYLATRSRAWLKLKCRHRQEFVVGGYTDPAGTRTGFGALLLGVYDAQGQLQYAGRVGTGFDQSQLSSLRKKFSAREINTPAFAHPPSAAEVHGVHWLRPDLVAEVNFAEWTEQGLVRHASFIALRSDKPAAEIVREQPLGSPAPHPREHAREPRAHASQQSKAAKPSAGAEDQARVAGIAITHPSRIVFPGAAWTKLDLAHYYASIADWILPHLRHRPLTLVRCPQGGGAQCFFQKHVNESLPDDIGRIEVPEDQGKAIYMLADNVPALISLVQMGVLEWHTWGAHAGKLDRPDRIIFDLDPAPDLAWAPVVEAAQLIRALLSELGLHSFVKTTGGKGLHIALPIVAERPWAEIKAFSKGIAEHLAATFPQRFTAKITKSQRSGKIFIDYLRNASGATAVAAYSTRARAGAPVSAPLAWDELTQDIRADHFHLGNIAARLAALRADPWEEYFVLKQRVSAKMLRSFVST